MKRWVFPPMCNRILFSLSALNRALQERVKELNAKIMQHLGKFRRLLFEAIDQPAQRSLPEQPKQFAL